MRLVDGAGVVGQQPRQHLRRHGLQAALGLCSDFNHPEPEIKQGRMIDGAGVGGRQSGERLRREGRQGPMTTFVGSVKTPHRAWLIGPA